MLIQKNLLYILSNTVHIFAPVFATLTVSAKSPCSICPEIFHISHIKLTQFQGFQSMAQEGEGTDRGSFPLQSNSHCDAFLSLTFSRKHHANTYLTGKVAGNVASLETDTAGINKPHMGLPVDSS